MYVVHDWLLETALAGAIDKDRIHPCVGSADIAYQERGLASGIQCTRRLGDVGARLCGTQQGVVGTVHGKTGIEGARDAGHPDRRARSPRRGKQIS